MTLFEFIAKGVVLSAILAVDQFAAVSVKVKTLPPSDC